MTVMLVDSSRPALEQAVKTLTQLNAAVTVVMQSSPAAAVSYAMYNPVDMIFSRPGLFTQKQMDQVGRYQPGIQWLPFMEGQDISTYLFPYITM